MAYYDDGRFHPAPDLHLLGRRLPVWMRRASSAERERNGYILGARVISGLLRYIFKGRRRALGRGSVIGKAETEKAKGAGGRPGRYSFTRGAAVMRLVDEGDPLMAH